MKAAVILLAIVVPGLAYAQRAPGAKHPPKASPEEAVAAFAVRPPDEGSPFFSEREQARNALRQQGRDQADSDSLATYPRVKDSPDSATAIFARFFTDMFSSVRLGKLRGEKTTEKLQVEPGQFSLSDRRELDATYTLRNNTGKIIRLEYPTTQRIDIFTTNPSGKVIEKWSDDRAFQPREGVVIINPKERIEYSEKVPTREMKPRETYTIQAEVIGYPDYTATSSVTASP